MELRRAEGQRRVVADQQLIRVGPAGEVHDPGPFIGPAHRRNLGLDHVPVLQECGPRDLTNGSAQIRPELLQVGWAPVRVLGSGRVEQRPRLVRFRQEPRQGVHDPFDRRSHGDTPVAQAQSQVGLVLLEKLADRSPAGDKRSPLGRGIDPLERFDVEDLDLWSFQRVHGPALKTGIDLGEVGVDLVHQLERGQALLVRQTGRGGVLSDCLALGPEPDQARTVVGASRGAKVVQRSS